MDASDSPVYTIVFWGIMAIVIIIVVLVMGVGPTINYYKDRRKK